MSRGPQLSGACLILFLALFAVGCRPRNRAEPGAGFYTGSLPDGRTVWLRWEPSEGEVSGELRSLATVDPERITGTNAAGSVLGRLQFGWSDEEPERGRFLLRTEGDGEHLGGFWRLPGRTNFEPVRFTKFAALERRRDTTRLRFRDYGIAKSATAAWPRFLAPDPFSQAVNGWLEHEADSRMSPFLSWSWEEIKEIWSWPERGASGEYHQDCRWDVVWRTNKLVSLLEFHDTYLGGAHGIHGYRGANFQWASGRLQELQLADFFRPESGWLRHVEGLVVADLRRQQASWYEESATNALAERTFTFNAQGLQVYYDPYEVGSYAEGTYTVHLPWDRLVPFLPTNGLVRLRPTGVVPKLPRDDP